MVRNEADVIEAFVRHHAEFLDRLLIVDHLSADGTGELLAELAAEGLPVETREERSPVLRRDAVLGGLMREAAAGGADWVIRLDADEFLLAPGSGPRAALGSLPRERPVTIGTRLYVPCPDDPRDEPNVLRRIRHRVESVTGARKVIVPARRTGTGRPAHTDRLVLAHFPVRSSRQLGRKALGGWPSSLAGGQHAGNGESHWRRAFDQVVAGRRLTPRQLQELTLDYAPAEPNGGRPDLVLDPVPARFEIRHRPPRDPSPREVLAQTTELLAEELSDTLREGAP